MTESEFEKLLRNPLVETATWDGKETRIDTPNGPGSSDRNMALWLAAETVTWIKENDAASLPIVERVWKFEQGVADIDMRVGVHGEYRKFKLTTARTGRFVYRIRIQAWDQKGVPAKVWERYGEYSGDEEFAGFETVPVR
jgi:hypothetical protein